MKIYIGNLHLKASETERTRLFETFGNVRSADIIMDKPNGQSRGFGFVQMDSQDAGIKAIHALNRLNYMNQYLEVSEAM
jgi:RNA recognition motif-containing protein